uniref:Uncharacterized protein n=1 Tax=Heterorhabditis bacteriophora TaxID=37862 RepID=A0A1I7XAA5_HETBA
MDFENYQRFLLDVYSNVLNERKNVIFQYRVSPLRNPRQHKSISDYKVQLNIVTSYK